MHTTIFMVIICAWQDAKNSEHCVQNIACTQYQHSVMERK